jgi:GNAT superfamily N-acetyltransferase
VKPPAGILTLEGDGSETYWGRPLEGGEAEDAYALHRLSTAGMAPGLVAADSREFFQSHVSQVGRILGIYTQRGLGAYAVLGLPGLGDPNFGTDHDLPAADLLQVAHLDGAGVHPRYRGNKLHRLLIEWRIAEAKKAGRSILLSTAAPENRFSLDNLLACGFRICGLKQKFGGLRYLLRCDLKHTPCPDATGEWVDIRDYQRQVNLFGMGMAGWRVRGGDQREIRFAAVRAGVR